MNELLCRIVTRFVNTPAEAVDEVIAASLREVADGLGVERGNFWRGAGRPPGVPARTAADDQAWFGRTDAVPDAGIREALRREGLQSVAVVPVVMAPGLPAPQPTLTFGTTRAGFEWSRDMRQQLALLAAVIGQALGAAGPRLTLAEANDDGGRRRRAPALAALHQAGEAQWQGSRGTIAPRSAAVRRALEDVAHVASTPATVLLLGETGVGKEVFAREIHARSARRQHAMVSINCAAVPGTLLESELFGRERGAFTGADTRQIGRFEAAQHSTIFLDEIGELSADAQVKLLRVLEQRVIERLGSSVPVPVDVRVITATNRDLAKAVADGTFREDLFYRLNVFPITIPPLRERPEDIEPLVWHFVDEISRRQGKTITSVAPASLQELQRYPWPGNVRELRNVIERAVIMATGPQLTVALPAQPLGTRPASSATTLDQLMTEHIRATLKITGCRIRGRGGAAERLGLKPTTLETRMAKLGISRHSLSA